jgi:SAM-dependent methyltransferase
MLRSHCATAYTNQCSHNRDLDSFVASTSQGEGFQPRAQWSPSTPASRLLFYLRLIADLQTNSIYRDLRKHLAGFSGRLLDIGCGNSPFRHLLDPRISEYQGIDVERASSFGYRNPETIYYDGRVIPFADQSFDAFLCTEVLEHVLEPSEVIREMHRILKRGGFGIITIPWSARFHYQPFDYHRYTPSALEAIFQPFEDREIAARGTDISSIASKIVVGYVRNILRINPSGMRAWLCIPFRLLNIVVSFPVLVVAVILGHCGIWFGLGSMDDPLGYTIIVKK